MVRKKGIPIRNLKNNTLQILTAGIESLEREERERIRATEGNQQRQNNNNNNGKRFRPKKHVCHVFDKGFDRPSHLDTHMLVHNGLKPFKCDVCEYACTTSSHLTTHLRVHSGEKPFKRHVCDYAFTQTGDIEFHSVFVLIKY